MNWYEFDKNRVVLEYQKMQSKYPNFIICKYEGKLAWEGEVNLIPEGIEAVPLKVRLIYPDGFPIIPPKVYPLEPELPKEMWGINGIDGRMVTYVICNLSYGMFGILQLM